MKKWLVSCALLFCFVSFVFAQAPNASIGEGDYKKLKGVIDNNTPIDSQGKVNLTKFEINKTHFERVQDDVNAFLFEHGSWLEVVFAMVPAVSWLFLINLWVWLFAFTTFVLNGKENFSENNGLYIGFGVFVILLISKVYVAIATGIHNILEIVITIVIPWGIIISVILSIVLIILAIYFWPVTVRLAGVLFRFIRSASKRKVREWAYKTAQAREEAALKAA